MTNIMIPSDLFISDSTRERQPLKMTIYGPTKAGKTYTALRLAFAIVRWLKENPDQVPEGMSLDIVAIDTERKRMSLYDGEVQDGQRWRWKKIELNPPYTVQRFQASITLANEQFPAVLIVDSFSHEWEGEGGVLQQHGEAGGRYQDWKTVTPGHQRVIDMILSSPSHTIVTMRSKMDYTMEEEETSTGKKKNVVTRVGMAPVQRNNVAYEFDFELDMQHGNLGKMQARYAHLHGWQGVKPGPDIIPPIMEWLSSGATPVWLPSFPEFVAFAKNEFPQLCKDLDGRELGQALSRLLIQNFPAISSGWDPRLADEAATWLRTIEANEVEALARAKSDAPKPTLPAAEEPAFVEAPSLPEPAAPASNGNGTEGKAKKSAKTPWPLIKKAQDKIVGELQKIDAPLKAFFDSLGVQSWEGLAQQPNLMEAKAAWSQFEIFWPANKLNYPSVMPPLPVEEKAETVADRVRGVALNDDEIPF